MAYTLISSTSKGSTGGGNVTTDAMSTTGADFLVLIGTSIASLSATFSDSSSGTNTFSTRTKYSTGTSSSIQIAYCQAPGFTSGSHTFTFGAGASSFPSLIVYAFSGSVATPYDSAENGGSYTINTSTTAGSVTPSQDNDLIVTGVSFDIAGHSGEACSGFSTPVVSTFSASNHYGVAAAWLLQTTAGASNPSWSWTGSTTGAKNVAAFKGTAPGGGGFFGTSINALRVGQGNL